MNHINNANDIEQNQGRVPESDQPEDRQQEELSSEQELQNIYREQQQLERQERESQALLANLGKGREEMLSRYRKLRRSKDWAVFWCIFVPGVIVLVSIGVFLSVKEHNNLEKVKIKQEYVTEYYQWKTHKFKDYYDSCMTENENARRMTAARLNESNRDEMNAYISSLNRVEKGLKTETFGPVTCFTDTQTYDLGGYTIAGSGNTVIFPGAVLKGDSLFRGSADYTLLSLERTPMYLTSNQTGGNSAEIENVSYRGVMEFLNSCAEKNEGQMAKEWSYYMQVCRSSAELKASLGVELSNIGKLEFGSTNAAEASSVAVIYKQIHYTVDAEPKKSAVEYFQGDADMAVLGDYEPAYISSVDYGRMVVVLIQGDMSSEELGARVSACIKGVGISAGLANIRMDSEITSQLLQYGGEQKDAGMVTDTSQKTLGIVDKWNEFWNGSEDKETVETRINNFICTNASATNPVPIGYTLKYLTDNSFVPAMMVTGQNTMLTERDAVRKVKITLYSDTDNRMAVDWNKMELAGFQTYATTTPGTVECEFLWDIEGAGRLQGQASVQDGKKIYEGEVSLNFSDYLPYGENYISLGLLECGENGFFNSATNPSPINANVVITDY